MALSSPFVATNTGSVLVDGGRSREARPSTSVTPLSPPTMETPASATGAPVRRSVAQTTVRVASERPSTPSWVLCTQVIAGRFS